MIGQTLTRVTAWRPRRPFKLHLKQLRNPDLRLLFGALPITPTTMDIYTHVLPDTKAEEIKKLDALIL